MEWKSIYDGYYLISDVGIIKRNWPTPSGYFGKEIKWGVSNKGYARVDLQVDRRRFSRFVHNLVAEAFIGPCPKRKEVNHKDTDKWNNSWTNLEYLTHKENIEHSVSFGLRKGITGPKGETHGAAKLRKVEVLKIRRLYGVHTKIALAKKYGVSRSCIDDIVKKRTWRHV